MHSKPTFKEILKIAIPLMIGGMSESISSIVDTAFMGHLGHIEMDSMGITNVFLLLLIMIGWACSRGVQVMISQNYGANQKENIGTIMDHGFYFTVPLSILIGFILYFNSRFLLSTIIDHPKILDTSVAICQIRAIGFPFLLSTMILSSFFIGIGQTRIILISQVTAAIVNIILNYILVFGKMGFAPMGYEGSAMATVWSEIIAILIFIVAFLINNKYIKEYFLFRFKRINFKIIKEIATLATPLATQYFFSIGAWVLFFSLIEKMGERELAISIILKQIFTAIAIPGFCLATTSNTMVGQLVGRRDIERIVPTVIKISNTSFMILSVLSLLTILFRHEVFGLFTTDMLLIEEAKGSFAMLMLAYLFIPYSNVAFNSIIALGNSKIPMFIEISVIVIYTIYMLLTLVWHKGGVMMAWTSEIFYWFLLVLFSVFFFRYTDWRKNIKYYDEKI